MQARTSVKPEQGTAEFSVIKASSRRERSRNTHCGRSAWRTTCGVFLLSLATAMSAPAPASPVFTSLVSFSGSDGALAMTSLVQGLDGQLYGTALRGGSSTFCDYGDFSSCGTVFKVSTSGALTVLYDFCTQGGGCPDGAFPGQLVLGRDGNFYGVTQAGGINNSICGGSCGTIFKITPTGTLTTLYSFCSQTNCTDGLFPVTLVQATDGNFYGATLDGGFPVSSCGSGGCGTIFKITPAGSLTTIHTFCATGFPCNDGGAPDSIVQCIDRNFYGTTASLGAHARGGLSLR